MIKWTSSVVRLSTKTISTSSLVFLITMPLFCNMTSISVYGYDTRIFGAEPSNIVVNRREDSRQTNSYHQLKKDSIRCPLLELPVELRAQIFSYILPYTINNGPSGVVWIKGCTALLACSSAIHDQAAQLMYERGCFLINITWDCSVFTCHWLSSSKPYRLAPQRTFPFPDVIGQRYRHLLQRLKVTLVHLDSYTGMVKYNYGNPAALAYGVRNQAEELCGTLKALPKLRSLQINFKNGSQNADADEIILEPFLALENVQKLKITGSVSKKVRQLIEDRF